MIVLGKEAYIRPLGGTWRKQEIDPDKADPTRGQEEMRVETLTKAPPR